MAGKRHLEGRVAVVTGAGRGIGRATALMLASEGASVVVNDLGCSLEGEGADRAIADEVTAQIHAAGGTAVANGDSVAGLEGARHVVQAALDHFGRLDVLVNNAGIMRDRPLLDMQERDWDLVLAFHMKGHFACTQAAARPMIGQGYGRIVNTSSITALGTSTFTRLDSTGGRCNYAAAKGGILGFTRAIAGELAGRGVTCNAIMPTATTRLVVAANERRAARGMVNPQTLVERPPVHVARLSACLASEEAAGITGRTFWVNEGRIALYSDPKPVRTIEQSEWSVGQLLRALTTLVAGE